MTANNFKVWEQAENLSTQMYFVELKDSFGKLSIFLKDINVPENTLEIRFSGILGYRVFQEGARLRLLNQDSTFGLINISIDSEFLRWLDMESEEMFKEWELKHFIVCNSDNIIDIVAVECPELFRLE
ncbi:hypothetical protein [Parapedobacter koreensis]|uniref:Immunity protein 50 n=1 Tax=Parapedobacter koreensis TaxID=332977 RepID=A0A1H7UEG7_9SPHI|nr:hypothetical protein [Parapedobacter koreensis]SEL95186.1 hypothetical protein SAMN05421740_11515 [Parapedobacter koreensis]